MDALRLFARESTSGECTKDTCPASASIYGYAPSWDFNLFFVIIFAACALVFYHQALFWSKWRAYSIACVIGCVLESGGYVGRLMLHKDSFSDFGFKLNVTLLTVAPAFISAGIYLTLKQATLTFGQHLSRLPPAWYAYIFVACDTISILLQGAGGAISAAATEKDLLDMGVNIMIAGLAFQVLTPSVFLGLVLEYVVRCRRNVHDLVPGSVKLITSRRFQLFAAAISLAFICILTRCCYRMAELSKGWGSELMRKEAEFIILDSEMCTVASLLLCGFHPQLFFRALTHVEIHDPPTELDSKFESRAPSMPKPGRGEVRVTYNDRLTEWEKTGVRQARHRI